MTKSKKRKRSDARIDKPAPSEATPQRMRCEAGATESGIDAAQSQNVPISLESVLVKQSAIDPFKPVRRSPLSTEMPLASQQLLFHHLQDVLESMCLRFGLLNCPAVMAKRRWTQTKSLELQKWTQFLSQAETHPPGFPVQVNKEEHKKLLVNVANIRHFAVHRCSRDIQSILTCLRAAHDFAELHQDFGVVEAISQLMAKLQTVFNDISSQQEIFHRDLKTQINNIFAQQRLLIHGSQEMALARNQQVLARAGERIVQLLQAPGNQASLVQQHIKDPGASGSTEDSFEPLDVEEIEGILHESEKLHAKP